MNYRYICVVTVRFTYYGKTFRHFYTKVTENMKISNILGKRLKMF